MAKPLSAAAKTSLKRFIKLMNDLPVQVAVEADAAAQQAAQTVASTIRAATPVGDTGALRESVKVVKNKRPMSYRIVAGGPKTTPGKGTFVGEFRDALAKSARGRAAGLGSQGLFNYARAVEFGTARGARGTGFFYKTFNRDKAALKREMRLKTMAALKDYFDHA